MNVICEDHKFNIQTEVITYSTTTGSRKPIRYFGLSAIGILILINLQVACTKVDVPFYNTILNSFDTSSYFVALNVKSSLYRGRAIIENRNLYNYLNKTKGFNKEKYQSFMKRLLAHNRILKVKDKDLFLWHFIKISEEASVIQIANQGRDFFVSHYFNGVMLKYGVPDDVRNAVINQLFYWEYPARIDKISGNLTIG